MKKEEVVEFLDSKGIKYKRFDHNFVHTIEDLQKLELYNYGVIAKNLFLRNANGQIHYLIVVKGDKKVNLKELGEKIGATRLSFASERRLHECLKLTKGSVTPFGILNNVDKKIVVVFDKELAGEEKIGFHPNSNDVTLFLAHRDIYKIISDGGSNIMEVEL